MGEPAPFGRRSRLARWLLAAGYVVFLVVTFLAAAEVVVRIQGWRPWAGPAIDISVDLAAPGNSNLPHDPHPSARAHRDYARALETCLRDRVLPRDAAPPLGAADAP